MAANRKKLLIVIFTILALAAAWIVVFKPSVDFKKAVDFKKVLPFWGRGEVERIAPSIFDKKADYLTLIASARETKTSFAYNSSGRRDPMMSLVEIKRVKPRRRVVSRPPPKLSLEGIIWSESEPEAVINGTILKENDFIKGAKVLQINRDSVILIYRSRKLVLRLE